MKELHEDLWAISIELMKPCEAAEKAGVSRCLEGARRSAITVGKAWSGSWVGNLARVYYASLGPPPNGERFGAHLGRIPRGRSAVFEIGRAVLIGGHYRWCEFSNESVRARILWLAPPLGRAQEISRAAALAFEEKRPEVLAILELALREGPDPILSKIEHEAVRTGLRSNEGFLVDLGQPGRNDGEEIETPPHISVLAEIAGFEESLRACRHLAGLARGAGSHLARIRSQTRRSEHGSAKLGMRRVFIGHGRSSAWLELKDFVKDRLGLPIEEFNRVPAAGASNKERLSEMLDTSAMAFLIFTGEDDHADGRAHARMNVVHEAGLFQGRHGFNRAIILLEEGCERFSNLDGLVYIAFPKGRISAAFEEIRRVVEREQLVPASGTTV